MDARQIDPESAWAPPGEVTPGAPPPGEDAPLPTFRRAARRGARIGMRLAAYLGGACSLLGLAYALAMIAFGLGAGRLRDGWALMMLLKVVGFFLAAIVAGALLGALLALSLRLISPSRTRAWSAAPGRARGTSGNRRERPLPDDPATKRPRRLWPRLAIGATAIALFVSLGMGIYLGRSVDRRLEAAIEAADRDDPHWRIDDLMAHREEVPDEENSALVVARALALIPATWPMDPPPFPGARDRPTAASEACNQLAGLPDSVRLDDAAAGALRDELQARAEAVRIARTVADRDKGRHEIVLGPAVIDTFLKETNVARTAALLLAADAAIRAHDGDADGALDSCRAILGVGRSIGDEPFIVSQLARIGIGDAALKSARRVLGQSEPSEAALARLQALLLDESRQPLFLHGIKGERGILFEITRRLRDGELTSDGLSGDAEAGPDSPRAMISPWARLMFDSQLAVGLEWMNEAVSIARKPPAGHAPLWEAWNATIAKVGRNRYARPGAIMPLAFAPATSISDWSLSRGQTEMRATAILLAAERHRLKAGKWPASVEEIDKEILPEPPADQFTGAPFRMEYRDGELLVYSLGPNQEDDGGEFDRRAWRDGGPDDVGGSLWDVGLRQQPPADPEMPEDDLGGIEGEEADSPAPPEMP